MLSFKRFREWLLAEKTTKKIAVLPGRFQPFHLGHKQVYDWAETKFGRGNVYILTSNKTEPGKSPWTFDEKRQMVEATGIPSEHIHMVSDPYGAREVVRVFDLTPEEQANTELYYVVGQKDMDEDPRFAFKAKKDGSAPYLQDGRKGDGIAPMSEHAYVVPAPTMKFKVAGLDATGATQIRAALSDPDKDHDAILKGLYGNNINKIKAIIMDKFQ
jgi:cytidyltransferase-like protein